MKSWIDNSSILLLCSKLKHLKGSVIQWQIAKKKQLLAYLNFIEQKLSKIFERCPSQSFEQEDLDLLKYLKHRKDSILSIEEASWRLRSQAIWFEKGDKNTKFFHKFATQRRIQNTIWDISDEEGNKKSTKSELKEMDFNHSKAQYCALDS
jgi:hypothetical protein